MGELLANFLKLKKKKKPESFPIPKYSKLGQTHKVEGVPKESMQSFRELAQSRVRVCSQEEYNRFQRDVLGADSQTTYPEAMFLVSVANVVAEEHIERWVEALDIRVNRDYFIIGEEDYTDLIPYEVEHEIYETWLQAKRGVKPTNSHMIHLLARRREWEIAAKDGKIERLLEYRRKKNDIPAEELDYAYKHGQKFIGK